MGQDIIRLLEANKKPVLELRSASIPAKRCKSFDDAPILGALPFERLTCMAFPAGLYDLVADS